MCAIKKLKFRTKERLSVAAAGGQTHFDAGCVGRARNYKQKTKTQNLVISRNVEEKQTIKLET